ncbi:MAG: hypothetical protein LBD51_03320 [Bifidobacteriaceae bacterium]|jgi:hypothetical protein|nr:hypothetical protein [Bifidobacteriaceae bacterium]
MASQSGSASEGAAARFAFLAGMAAATSDPAVFKVVVALITDLVGVVAQSGRWNRPEPQPGPPMPRSRLHPLADLGAAVWPAISEVGCEGFLNLLSEIGHDAAYYRRLQSELKGAGS